MKSLISNRINTNPSSEIFQFAAVNEGGSSLASYDYDADGNRVSKTLANGVTTAYSYDNDNRLLTLNHTFASGSTVPSQNFTYTLNSVGDRTSRAEALGAVSSTDNYSYDAIDQITEVAYGVINGTVSYNYDAVGNRTSVTDSVNGNTSYTTNNLNQYTTVAAQVPQYDSNGNLTNINGWTYTYDAQNRLLSADNGAGTSETFAYDPQNRCVSRSLTVSGTTTTTNFLYDGWELIEELDGSSNEQAAYVPGARIDELLTKSNASGTVFYQHDDLGSTTALTDTNGNLVERYTYDIFGKPSVYDASGSSLTTSTYGNRFLFTGREYFQELGLYDYRNRVYSADLGRFLQTDPIRFSAGDVNIYRYAENDVVGRGDPFGQLSIEIELSTAIAEAAENGMSAEKIANTFAVSLVTAEAAVKTAECEKLKQAVRDAKTNVGKVKKCNCTDSISISKEKEKSLACFGSRLEVSLIKSVLKVGTKCTRTEAAIAWNKVTECDKLIKIETKQ